MPGVLLDGDPALTGPPLVISLLRYFTDGVAEL